MTNKAPYLAVIGESILFLYAPFLFLYTQSVTSNRFRFGWYYAFHFAPFLMILGYFLFVFHLQPLNEKINMIRTGSLYHPVVNNNLWLMI